MFFRRVLAVLVLGCLGLYLGCWVLLGELTSISAIPQLPKYASTGVDWTNVDQVERLECNKVRGREICRSVMVPRYTKFQLFGVHLRWPTPMKMNQLEKLDIQFVCALRSFIATIGPLSNGKSILSSILQLRLFSDDFSFVPSNSINLKAADYFKTNHAGEKTIAIRAKAIGPKKIFGKFYVLTEESTSSPESRFEYPPERIVTLNLDVLPESTVLGLNQKTFCNIKRIAGLIGVTLWIVLIVRSLPLTRPRSIRLA